MGLARSNWESKAGDGPSTRIRRKQTRERREKDFEEKRKTKEQKGFLVKCRSGLGREKIN